VFDVGFTELLLIGIVALVVIGPERLPAVARTAGQWIAKLQRFVRGVKSDLASELESGDLKKLIGDQREQINELKQMVNSARKDFESSTKEVVRGAKKSLSELESSVKQIDSTKASKAGSASVDTTPAEQSGDTLNSDDSSSDRPQDHAVVHSSAPESKPGDAQTADAISNAGTEQIGPPSSDRSSSQASSAMRKDSPGSMNGSAGMDRTGTEPGN
jgi:sec-independent protein translocase protein TatB